ncbi:MAG TPA: AmmeMemoRadiSam system radical SAM enzyme, partial [Candidatus Omnitrophota bacterium]|nr:AmmeMemoRadiSam system radical SAM enzyme [Candidatus Omnitrophota bacterium]
GRRLLNQFNRGSVQWTVSILLFLLISSASAIQFDPGFSSVKEALDKIREANLSKLEAMYWRGLPGDVVQCGLCPNRCVLPNGRRGLCGIRVNIDGKLYTTVYGKPTAIHVDPIEKKPLSHFLPGTTAFSISTAGCNLGCLFCQNWQISQVKPEDAAHYDLDPDQIIEMAVKSGAPTIAYTYNEPTVYYEYMLQCAKLAKARGLRNVFHSSGYINREPLLELLKYTDACNIDLKGFSEKYYQDMCFGHLDPVLETLKTIKGSGVWLEITNLVIPGKNDDPKMVREMCQWIANELGPDVPLYFSAFYPMYKLQGVPPTPVKTLEDCAKIAKECGLHYVYIGNVYGNAGADTYCPKCGKMVIEREGYAIKRMEVVNGKCRYCGGPIAGVWK